ncbi:hypothetical protein D915_006679 [Fasciola hepatica]|uniref:Saposin B-type domain-containing protein n=1 Tax=Fasciola hepatica TaxID=6192 RepID=A0A4E0RL27_FASHE|nr:hypothetical protein D915_006679 [Fasciola hepatica]
MYSKTIVVCVLMATICTVRADDEDSGSGECRECHTFFKLARQALTNHDVLRELKWFTLHACRLIPNHRLSHKCRKFAKVNLDKYLRSLSKIIRPQAWCKHIRLCPAESVIDEEELENVLGTVSKCAVCKTTVDAAKRYLTSQEIIGFEKEMIEKLCDRLPLFKEVCAAELNNGVDYIVKHLMFITSEEICEKFHICP